MTSYFFKTFGQNYCSRDDTIFCGVFDGHGPYGHLVAKRVRDLLPVKLGADLVAEDGRETSTSNIKRNANEVGSPEHIDRGVTVMSSEAEETGDYPEIFPALRASFLKAFRVMDRDLKLHKNIDCFFSGTTAVAVIKQVTEPNGTINLFLSKISSFCFVMITPADWTCMLVYQFYSAGTRSYNWQLGGLKSCLGYQR
jgi:hypothetical protein